MNNQPTSRFAPYTVSFFILLAAMVPSFSTALEADKKQELVWSADGSSRMSITGETRFLEMSENVKMTQGTLQISGDEATIEYNISTNEILKVTVIGNPVHYQQQLNSDDGVVTGSSKTISLYTDEDDGSTVVELIGEAIIESPTSNIMCNAIVYIADQDLIREAPGPCTGVFNSSAQ